MKKFLLFFLFIIIVLFIYQSKTSEIKKREEVVKIGFVASLSGKYSILGNSIRNGVVLGFEEANYKTGNKKIELIFGDDKQDENINKGIVESFIKKGVKIIIGNVTSTMSLKTVKIIDKEDSMIMITAASATDSLSRIDDSFFRIHLANNMERFDYISKYLIKNSYRNIVGIYDPLNPDYTKNFLTNFEKSFIKAGGNRYQDIFSSKDDLDILSSRVKNVNPDLIVISANSVDTAKIAQYFRVNGINTKIFSSEWAMTNEFIQNGGKNVNGILFNIDFDNTSTQAKYLEFKNKYIDKFGEEPSFFAVKGYEISKIILDVLSRYDEKELKKGILEKRVFDGLQSQIIFDKYGDISKKTFILEVDNGKFKRVD